MDYPDPTELDISVEDEEIRRTVFAWFWFYITGVFDKCPSIK